MSWPNGAHARLQAVGEWPLCVVGERGGGEGGVGQGGCLEVQSVWLPGMEASEGEGEKGKERAALLTSRLVSALSTCLPKIFRFQSLCLLAYLLSSSAYPTCA